jgi:hypothetical protein
MENDDEAVVVAAATENSNTFNKKSEDVGWNYGEVFD